MPIVVSMDYSTIQSAYIAKEGLLNLLLEELGDPQAVESFGLVLSQKSYRPLYFAQCGWINPQLISFTSIKDATVKLKALAPFFAFYPTALKRKGELIREGLRKVKNQPVAYDDPLPRHGIGGFTLIDEQHLIASSTTTSRYPHGIVPLIEDKIPPSRAYLKLLEALHLIQDFPKSGQRCLEIGASPGSWTYCLAKMGLKVLACDRAPLKEQVMRAGDITFLSQDAFQLTPDKVGPIDWLFSDIICYPQKLLEFVKKWVDSNQVPRIIATIKLQGAIDWSLLQEFSRLPHSQVLHLYHNKHELTWIYQSPQS